MTTLYKCDDCSYTGTSFPEAKNLHMRLDPGGTYTDVECPECGALAYEIENPEKVFTVCVFRMWKDIPTGVIALFPQIDETLGNCLFYEHVGQHGPADYKAVIARTRPATEKEYEPLLRELQSMGYRLFIRKRYTRKKGC